MGGLLRSFLVTGLRRVLNGGTSARQVVAS